MENDLLILATPAWLATYSRNVWCHRWDVLRCDQQKPTHIVNCFSRKRRKTHLFTMVVGVGGRRQGGEAAAGGSSWKLVVVKEGVVEHCWCHQIDCRCLPRLVWEGEADTVFYILGSTYPTTAVWLSRYIATLHACDIHCGYGSILADVLFFIL